MIKSVEDITIIFIGAGNVATNLAKALYQKGFRIEQVYSRTAESAETLASEVKATWTTDLAQIKDEEVLYIVSLKDAAFTELVPQITAGRSKGIFVHTSGSIPMNIWKGKTPNYGVIYPLQTFSKKRNVDFNKIPVFIEACCPKTMEILRQTASALSEKVEVASSEQRQSLHIAAVFACNFTNHMYTLAADLLKKYNLSFDALLPLIDETAYKVHQLPPDEAQTGPAVRYDKNVIDKHLAMLTDEPSLQDIYRMLTQSIFTRSQQVIND